MNIPISLRLFSGNFFQVVPFAVILAFLFRNSFRFSRKKVFYVTAAVIAASSAAFAVIGTYIAADKEIADKYQAVNGIFFCSLVPVIIWFFAAVKSDRKKMVFSLSFVFMSAVFVTIIGNYISNALPGYGDGLPYAGLSIPTIIITNGFAAAALCLFLKKFYIPVEDGLSEKEARYVALMSLCLCLIVTVAFFITYHTSAVYDLKIIVLKLTVMLMVFVLYGVVFKMYAISHEKHIAFEKQLQSEFQIEIRDEQYKRIYGAMETIRRQRHDIRHHMILLQGYIDSGDTEKASEYLRHYLENSPDHKVVKYCENPVVNMLVCHYTGIAEENGISFSVRIDIPDKLPVHDTDISVIIGNLLENAVEAAIKVSAELRIIKLHMGCMGKMLGITVDNGFDGIVKKIDGRYLSTKSDHGGIGLSSIADIAEKYGGGVEFGHEGNMFYSSVMLGLEAKEKAFTNPL